MDPERWRRIKDVFAHALELTPGERGAFLASALPDDPSLVAEVEELVAAHAGASDFYDHGVLAAIPELREQLEGAAEGMRIGSYRIVSELGRGGMGAVYLAVRDEPGFAQKVAIKLIKRGMDTDEIVRRFVAERQILASLAHPNIARLLDGGSTPDGRPFFVMEYIEGRPITLYAEEQGLPVEARLRLFLSVCRAVQHAHQSLVVHRDLKPANILVDAQGEPKLLDFGIAKLLDSHPFDGLTALTALSPGPMTPDYASPEQQDGGPVTTATDVYGLGLLLYELLVGESPRSIERKLGEGWRERPPSQALRALAALGDAEQHRAARRLSGDLDTIVGKALERDPARRYGTAHALAEDIERHLTLRPVTARRPTLAYRLGRTLVRHKAVAALALGLVLFAATSSYQAFDVRRQRDHAEGQRERAEALNRWIKGLIQKANPEQSRGESLTVREVLDAGAQDLLGRSSKHQPETWAALLETTGTIYQDLGFYDRAAAFLNRARQLREPLPGERREANLALAGTLSALAKVDLKRERYADARRLYERALALKEHWLGLSALGLVEDLNGLALVDLAENRREEAASILARALSISRLAIGEDQTELASTLNSLGILSNQEGKFSRARLLFRSAHQHFGSIRGDDDPATIQTRSNLATASSNLADYESAGVLYREIVDMRRRLLEPNHPAIAEALLQLAIAERRRGRLEEAGRTLDELLEVRRAQRLPRDSTEAETLHLIGASASDQGDLARAERALGESYEVYRSLSGEHRAEMAGVLRSQALVWRQAGQPARAVALARRSVDLTQAATGAKNPLFANALQLYAEILREAGQPQRAESTFRQALALRSGAQFANHPDRVASLLGLGALLVENGRAGQARAFLEEAVAIRRRIHDAAGTARAESLLGTCYAALPQYRPRSRALLEQSYRTLLRLHGPDHGDTRKAARRLAEAG